MGSYHCGNGTSWCHTYSSANRVSTGDGHTGATGKLAAKYEGLYTVKGKINEVTYWVGLARCSRDSQAFHVSALRPVTQGPLAGEDGSSFNPHPLVETEGGPAYKVTALLDSRRRGKGLQYLVDWEGLEVPPLKVCTVIPEKLGSSVGGSVCATGRREELTWR
ncbi:hypothetical protein P4O66_001399 [Electrophorus voltai]|uniref:Chromo domain-containing protein n=1 Tax=Electrophorus voltai TaxID=2609070 RepID=A0AAD9DUQ8_9TELE|nr:hypothetical protein P4O66_001399 [Electrophorus voltai]